MFNLKNVLVHGWLDKSGGTVLLWWFLFLVACLVTDTGRWPWRMGERGRRREKTDTEDKQRRSGETGDETIAHFGQRKWRNMKYVLFRHGFQQICFGVTLLKWLVIVEVVFVVSLSFWMSFVGEFLFVPFCACCSCGNLRNCLSFRGEKAILWRATGQRVCRYFSVWQYVFAWVLVWLFWFWGVDFMLLLLLCWCYWWCLEVRVLVFWDFTLLWFFVFVILGHFCLWGFCCAVFLMLWLTRVFGAQELLCLFLLGSCCCCCFLFWFFVGVLLLLRLRARTLEAWVVPNIGESLQIIHLALSSRNSSVRTCQKS